MKILRLRLWSNGRRVEDRSVRLLNLLVEKAVTWYRHRMTRDSIQGDGRPFRSSAPSMLTVLAPAY